jgi:hypothetical protein
MPSSVASALLRSARSYAGQLTSLIKSLAPNHLKDNVESHATEIEEGKIVISVKVTGADAHAQEYGSGLHKERGTKAKYPILPKRGKYLAFSWEIANANPELFRFLPDGRVILPSVMHPGIEKFEGRGYVRPAIKELRAKIRQKGSGIREEIRQAILSDIRKSFVGAGKK